MHEAVRGCDWRAEGLGPRICQRHKRSQGQGLPMGRRWQNRRAKERMWGQSVAQRGPGMTAALKQKTLVSQVNYGE